MTTLKVGIASYEEMKARTMANHRQGKVEFVAHLEDHGGLRPDPSGTGRARPNHAEGDA